MEYVNEAMAEEEMRVHRFAMFAFYNLLDPGWNVERLYLVTLVSIHLNLYSDAFYVFYSDDCYVMLNAKILDGNCHKSRCSKLDFYTYYF